MCCLDLSRSRSALYMCCAGLWSRMYLPRSRPLISLCHLTVHASSLHVMPYASTCSRSTPASHPPAYQQPLTHRALTHRALTPRKLTPAEPTNTKTSNTATLTPPHQHPHHASSSIRSHATHRFPHRLPSLLFGAFLPHTHALLGARFLVPSYDTYVAHILLFPRAGCIADIPE